MDWVILGLTFPLVVLSLIATFGPRKKAPAAVAAAVAAAAPLPPPPLEAAGSWLVGRVFPWIITLAFLIGIVMGLANDIVPGSRDLLHLSLLSRYGLLIGLLLTGLAPLALYGVPTLLANLFVLRAPRQVFHVTWMSVLTGTLVVVVCRVVELNAWARYETASPHFVEGPGGLVRILALLFLCLPIPLVCLRCSHDAFLPAKDWRWTPWISYTLAGLLLALSTVAAVAGAQSIFLSPNVTAPDLYPLQGLGEWGWKKLGLPRSESLYPAGDLLAHFFSFFDERGYCEHAEDGSLRLAPGHAQATLGFGLFLGVYVGFYLIVRVFRLRVMRFGELSALFLVLQLLLLLGGFLQGAAFALDLFHIPVSLAVGLFSFLLYWSTRSDHFFDLTPARSKPPPVPPPPVPDLNDAAACWNIPALAGTQDSGHAQRTLVVVTASGGGIQAAAWITRALIGLQQLYGDSFSRSIGLMSGVSGGSVGLLHYLDRWQTSGSPLLPNDCTYPANHLPAPDTICGRAMASSLEATAWGIVFPDLIRILLPPLVSSTDDRGFRIEEAWRGRMDNADVRLSDWIGPIRAGQMPIPVFNATVVETGQRFLASPVRSRPRPTVPAAACPREVVALYSGAEVPAATMVRLSATFPFISPIARPLHPDDAPWPESNAYHFADGGYVDNEGMITVIEWLYDLLDPAYLNPRTFDRILLVRLMPFPASRVETARLRSGWFYSIWGPIEALQNVRTASQMERNELAVKLFTDAAAQRGVPVRSAALRFDVDLETDPPLSWMLTDPQKSVIDLAWQQLINPHNPILPLQEIDAWFSRTAGSAGTSVPRGL